MTVIGPRTRTEPLPRVELLRILGSPNTFEDRQLYALLMKKYQRLWEVDSVEEDIFTQEVVFKEIKKKKPKKENIKLSYASKRKNKKQKTKQRKRNKHVLTLPCEHVSKN